MEYSILIMILSYFLFLILLGRINFIFSLSPNSFFEKEKKEERFILNKVFCQESLIDVLSKNQQSNYHPSKKVKNIQIKVKKHPIYIDKEQNEISFNALYTYIEKEYFVDFNIQKIKDKLSPLLIRNLNKGSVFNQLIQLFRKKEETLEDILEESSHHPVESEVFKQNANPTKQAIKEIIANALDAGGESIGKFGRGGKQDIALLTEEGDCLTRWIKKSGERIVLEYRVRRVKKTLGVRIREYDMGEISQRDSWSDVWEREEQSGTIWEIKKVKKALKREEIEEAVLESFPMCRKVNIELNGKRIPFSMYTLEGDKVEDNRLKTVKVQTGREEGGKTDCVRVIDNEEGMTLESLLLYYISSHSSFKRMKEGKVACMTSNYNILEDPYLPEEWVICSNGMKIKSIKTQENLGGNQKRKVYIELGSIDSLRESRSEGSLELREEVGRILYHVFKKGILDNCQLNKKEKIRWVDCFVESLKEGFFQTEREKIELKKIIELLKNQVSCWVKSLDGIVVSKKWKQTTALLDKERVYFVNDLLVDEDNKSALKEMLLVDQIGVFQKENSDEIKPIFLSNFSPSDIEVPTTLWEREEGQYEYFVDESGIYISYRYKEVLRGSQSYMFWNIMNLILEEKGIKGKVILYEKERKSEKEDKQSLMVKEKSKMPFFEYRGDENEDPKRNMLLFENVEESPNSIESMGSPLRHLLKEEYIYDTLESGELVIISLKRWKNNRDMFFYQIRPYDQVYKNTGEWIKVIDISKGKNKVLYKKEKEQWYVYDVKKRQHMKCKENNYIIVMCKHKGDWGQLIFFDEQGELLFFDEADEEQYLVRTEDFVKGIRHFQLFRTFLISKKGKKCSESYMVDESKKRLILPIYKKVESFEHIESLSRTSIENLVRKRSEINSIFKGGLIKKGLNKEELLRKHPDVVKVAEETGWFSIAKRFYWWGSFEDLGEYQVKGCCVDLGDIQCQGEFLFLEEKEQLIGVDLFFERGEGVRQFEQCREENEEIEIQELSSHLLKITLQDNESWEQTNIILKKEAYLSEAQNIIKLIQRKSQENPLYRILDVERVEKRKGLFYLKRENKKRIVSEEKLIEIYEKGLLPSDSFFEENILLVGEYHVAIKVKGQNLILPVKEYFSSDFNESQYQDYLFSESYKLLRDSIIIVWEGRFPLGKGGEGKEVRFVDLSQIQDQAVDLCAYKKVKAYRIGRNTYEDGRIGSLNKRNSVFFLRYQTEGGESRIVVDDLEHIASKGYTCEGKSYDCPLIIEIEAVFIGKDYLENPYIVKMEEKKNKIIERKTEKNKPDIYEGFIPERLIDRNQKREGIKGVFSLKNVLSKEGDVSRFELGTRIHLRTFLQYEKKIKKEFVDQLLCEGFQGDKEVYEAILYALFVYLMKNESEDLNQKEIEKLITRIESIKNWCQGGEGRLFCSKIVYARNVLFGKGEEISQRFQIKRENLDFILCYDWKDENWTQKKIDLVLKIRDEFKKEISEKKIDYFFQTISQIHELESVLKRIEKIIVLEKRREEFLYALETESWEDNIEEFLRSKDMKDMVETLSTKLTSYLYYILDEKNQLMEYKNDHVFSERKKVLSMSEIRSLYQRQLNKGEKEPQLSSLWNRFQEGKLSKKESPTRHIQYDYEIDSEMNNQRSEGQHVIEFAQNAMDDQARNIWFNYYKVLNGLMVEMRDDSEGFSNWFDILIAKRTSKLSRKDMIGCFGRGALTYWENCDYLEIENYKKGQRLKVCFEKISDETGCFFYLTNIENIPEDGKEERGVVVRRFIRKKEGEIIEILCNKAIEDLKKGVGGVAREGVNIYYSRSKRGDGDYESLTDQIVKVQSTDGYLTKNIELGKMICKQSLKKIQIRDKVGFLVCIASLDHPYFDLIHPHLKEKILTEKLTFYIGYPLIRDRSQFEKEEENLEKIQAEIALAFYRYICEKVVDHPIENQLLPFLRKKMFFADLLYQFKVEKMLDKEKNWIHYLKKISQLSLEEISRLLGNLKVKNKEDQSFTTIMKTLYPPEEYVYMKVDDEQVEPLIQQDHQELSQELLNLLSPFQSQLMIEVANSDVWGGNHLDLGYFCTSLVVEKENQKKVKERKKQLKKGLKDFLKDVSQGIKKVQYFIEQCQKEEPEVESQQLKESINKRIQLKKWEDMDYLFGEKYSENLKTVQLRFKSWEKKLEESKQLFDEIKEENGVEKQRWIINREILNQGKDTLFYLADSLLFILLKRTSEEKLIYSQLPAYRGRDNAVKGKEVQKLRIHILSCFLNQLHPKEGEQEEVLGGVRMRATEMKSRVCRFA